MAAAALALAALAAGPAVAAPFTLYAAGTLDNVGLTSQYAVGTPFAFALTFDPDVPPTSNPGQTYYAAAFDAVGTIGSDAWSELNNDFYVLNDDPFQGSDRASNARGVLQERLRFSFLNQDGSVLTSAAFPTEAQVRAFEFRQLIFIGDGQNFGGGRFSFVAAPEPLPEASAWATMVAGTGLAGAALRRRRRARACPA